MLGHNFSWETWCRQIECLERRGLAYLKEFSKRKKNPCTYILLFISEFKIKTLQSSKIWARFSFFDQPGEKIHVFIYRACMCKYICIHTHSVSWPGSLRTRMKPCYMREREGRCGFEKKTHVKQSYSLCLNITERSLDTMVGKTVQESMKYQITWHAEN